MKIEDRGNRIALVVERCIIAVTSHRGHELVLRTVRRKNGDITRDGAVSPSNGNS